MTELPAADLREFASTHATLSIETRDATWRRRLGIAIALALAVNIGLVGTILWLSSVPKPIVFRVIPVHIVTVPPPPAEQPPPPKPPEPARRPPAPPQPKPESKPPPRQNQASEDIGDPTAPPDSTTASQQPPAGPAQKTEGTDQPTDQGNRSLSAAASEPPLLGAVGRQVPKLVPKPLPTEGGDQTSAPKPEHSPKGHRAKLSGPAAIRNTYLALINAITQRHADLLSSAETGGRAGLVRLKLTVMRNGVIVFVTVASSSGYPDIDQKAIDMINAVGNFPPLPESLWDPDNQTTELTFSEPFPTDRLP